MEDEGKGWGGAPRLRSVTTPRLRSVTTPRLRSVTAPRLRSVTTPRLPLFRVSDRLKWKPHPQRLSSEEGSEAGVVKRYDFKSLMRGCRIRYCFIEASNVKAHGFSRGKRESDTSAENQSNVSRAQSRLHKPRIHFHAMPTFLARAKIFTCIKLAEAWEKIGFDVM